MPSNMPAPGDERVAINGDVKHSIDAPDHSSNHEELQKHAPQPFEGPTEVVEVPPLSLPPPLPTEVIDVPAPSEHQPQEQSTFNNLRHEVPPPPGPPPPGPPPPILSIPLQPKSPALPSQQDSSPPALGQISKVHCLYGITTGSEKHPRLRWSDHETPREEEQSLMKNARNSAIIHRKIPLEYPTNGQSWESHSLEIQSPHLRRVLKKVLAGYPDLSLDAPTLEFKPHYHAFVHRWQQLKAEKQHHEGALSAEIDLLMKELDPVIADARDALEKSNDTGLLAWKNLWLIFPPGELVLAKDDLTTLYRLVYIELWDEDDVMRNVTPYWNMELQQVDWNGRDFGYSNFHFRYQWYKGEHPVMKLEYCPLRLWPPGNVDATRILVERGKKFESLRGSHYKAYNGKKYTLDWERMTLDGHPRELAKSFSGRIVVDAFAYHQYEYAGGARSCLTPFSEKADKFGETANTGERNELVEPLTKEQLMLAVPRVKGFDLKDNEWCEFDVDSISDIDFKEDAFQKLILPEGEKKMLKAFMDREGQQKCGWDDIIPGKGKGVIILLAGPPGVGKTLTAESVSEEEKVPLYTLRAGDMGTDIPLAEERLQVALECCKLWNAVFLIDEADVFLGARTATSTVQQNELVSIFLRRLEYYSGLLFLTTNRYSSIDEAFRSRIDLILPFSPLDQPTRAAIWKTFVETVPESDCAISPADLEALSQHELNGREIKNTVKTARLLAHSENTPLGMQHLGLLLSIKQRIAAAGQGP